MAINKMKEDWTLILKNMKNNGRWSEEDRSIPITQSNWFTGLVLHIIEYRRMTNKQDRVNHMFVVFGHLAHYILKNYSIKPAADILSSMERNEKRVFEVENKGRVFIDPQDGTEQIVGFYRQNPDNFLDLIENITLSGYERCGTSTIFPFAYWLGAENVTLSTIRELLARDINASEQEKIKNLTEETLTDENISFKKEENEPGKEDEK